MNSVKLVENVKANDKTICDIKDDDYSVFPAFVG